MKKKLLALFLCFQILISIIQPSIYITAASVEPDLNSVEDELGGSDTNVSSNSIFPECQLRWMTFSDYLVNQANAAWENPQVYIGYEAEFLKHWNSIECIAGFTGNETSKYVSLNFDGTKNALSITPGEFKMVIEDYHYDKDSKKLWYKVKAADGYVLPDVLAENPYILYIEETSLKGDLLKAGYPPTFIIGQLKGIFNVIEGKVTFKKQHVAASVENAVDVSLLPGIFNVEPLFVRPKLENGYYGTPEWTNHYDLGDIASKYTEYSYVSESSVLLIPAEASFAYEKLMSAKDVYEYYEILNQIPQSILALLSEHHRTALGENLAALEELEKVHYETVVDFGGKELPISVSGKLPDGVELRASVVSLDTVLAEGFDVKEDGSDIITSLDIKLVYTADGAEWQPEEGRRVAVSIGLSALGYEDGTVVRLQHKHENYIDNYDIAVVQDGALTVLTSGFSIYTATSVTSTTANNANKLADNKGTITLEIGTEKILYIKVGNNNNTANGTWSVTDPTGAIHYTVHSQSTIGNGGMYVPWIKINPLKLASGENAVKLSYSTSNTTENYTVNIVNPKADKGERKLYLKDDINSSGRIVAALVDDKGNEIENGLAGAAFEWSRSDGYYIDPDTFDVGYGGVNIALDHGGLVESRKDPTGTKFQPVTYSLKAILSNGKELEAEYTVYYQSEIINADFEFPATSRSENYTYFPNGWPELHWKTTAPGTGSKISMDIEYGYHTRNGSTSWGVTQAANGKQFAEINAEAFGALYQDIITVPGEEIDWNFAHAPRQGQSWAPNITNAMFIVIGATEAAQKLTYEKLKALGAAAKEAGDNNADFKDGKVHVEVTYEGAKYYVWYHDAGSYEYGQNHDIYDAAHKYGWTELSGTYKAPEGQYRTRLFFMSEEKPNSENPNAGNLIDTAKGGQYKKYRIEYYLQEIGANNQLQNTPLKEVDGDALLHESVKLTDLATYTGTNHYYLQKILINGGNYPYNVKYAGDASLYIEKYEAAKDFDITKFGDGKREIVMQVYLRKVAISVQTEIVFPEEMTEEQRLSVIQNITDGYQVGVQVKQKDAQDALDSGKATITNRGPMGGYTAYCYFEKDVYLDKDKTYQVIETSHSDIRGLVFAGVTYETKLYENGQAGQPLESSEFTLKDQISFAEITIKIKYTEKETTIYYKGVGNGKVAFAEGDVYMDTPTETLAFYSGKAKGAKVLPGDGAEFAGWFKDEACTKPVEAVDGVVGADNSFKPNANIINDETVTFYAKFETGSVVINRENANPGQVFVYHVRNTEGLDMYVTLKCDANGKGTVAILEASLTATYTVTELSDWSWRNSPDNQKNGSHEADKNQLTFTFNDVPSNKKWINDYGDPVSNVYGILIG